MSLPFFLKWTIYGQFLYLIVVQGGLNEIFLFGREEGFQLNGQYIQEGNSLHVVVLPLNCRLDQYWGCPKSRIAPFAIVYFGKKYYLTVAKTKHYSNG